MKTRIIYGLIFLIMTSIFFQQAANVQAAEPPELDAPSAILVDADTGKVLYEKNADRKLSPASMTKMMAEYLILDAIEEGEISWDSEVRINDYMYKLSQHGGLSGVPLRKDVTYTVEELYTAMVVYSANAATIAIGAKIYGNEEAFVEAMNEKAKELGMDNTTFVNSTGLNNSSLFGHIAKGGPNDENVMPARDTAKLAYHLLKDHEELVLKYSSMEKAEFTKGVDEPIEMDNWNFMLPGLVYGEEGNGVDGLKTGHTAKAGFCFTGTAKRGDMRLISVVMKTDSVKARFDQTKKLLNYGFSNFEKETLLEEGYVPEGKDSIAVTKGKQDKTGIETNTSITAVVAKGTKEDYKPTFSLAEEKKTLTAPVEKGEQVGTIEMTYTGNDESYGYLTEGAAQLTAPVVTTESVEKASWFTLMMRGIGDFFSGIWTGITDTVTGWF